MVLAALDKKVFSFYYLNKTLHSALETGRFIVGKKLCAPSFMLDFFQNWPLKSISVFTTNILFLPSSLFIRKEIKLGQYSLWFSSPLLSCKYSNIRRSCHVIFLIMSVSCKPHFYKWEVSPRGSLLFWKHKEKKALSKMLKRGDLFIYFIMYSILFFTDQTVRANVTQELTREGHEICSI